MGRLDSLDLSEERKLWFQNQKLESPEQSNIVFSLVLDIPVVT